LVFQFCDVAKLAIYHPQEEDLAKFSQIKFLAIWQPYMNFVENFKNPHIYYFGYLLEAYSRTHT